MSFQPYGRPLYWRGIAADAAITFAVLSQVPT